MNKFLLLFFLFSFYIRAQDFRFNNYNINDGLSQSSVNTIVQDDNGGLWIGTQDGLNRFDGNTFEIFNSDETEGIESPFINASIKTDDGKLWFGSRNGLTMFNPNTEKFQTYTIDKNKILDIQDMSLSLNKELCIATLGYGVVKFSPKYKTFKENYTPKTPQVIWQRIIYDLDTPVSAGLKLMKERTYYKSKFNISSLFSLALDGILNHSIIPLRIATFVGLFISFITDINLIKSIKHDRNFLLVFYNKINNTIIHLKKDRIYKGLLTEKFI